MGILETRIPLNYVSLCDCLRAATWPPPDPAGLGEQGRDQQNVHDEVEQVEELQAPQEASDEEGDLDDVAEQEPQESDRGATRDEEGVLDDVVEQEPRDPERGGA